MSKIPSTPTLAPISTFSDSEKTPKDPKKNHTSSIGDTRAEFNFICPNQARKNNPLLTTVSAIDNTEEILSETMLYSEIFFGQDSADYNMETIAGFLIENQITRIQLTGYADADCASASLNETVAGQRAEIAAETLKNSYLALGGDLGDLTIELDTVIDAPRGIRGVGIIRID